MTKKIASRLLKTIILAIFVFPSIHPGRMGINILFMNTNVDLFHDSTKNSSEILTSESNEMGLSTIFNYNGNNVAFIKTSYGILINATDMARPYNKRPVDYLRQIYVNELVSTIVSQTHISEDQLVIKRLYIITISYNKYSSIFLAMSISISHLRSLNSLQNLISSSCFSSGDLLSFIL